MTETTKSKILIIDDDEFTLKVFSYALKQAGYEVDTAKGGNEGMAMIAKINPRLVFLDLLMSPPNGFEIMKKFGQGGYRFVVVSSLIQKEDKQKAMELGAAEYIVKEGLPTRTIVAAAGRLAG